jgi:Rod binding domain-containing protein
MTLNATHSGIQAFPNRQSGVATAGAQPETPAHKKLRKAAQDFEGILISQLWEHLQTSFSSFGGETPLAGSDTLNSLAIQTLSTALASRGGLGIGKMLVHQLEPTLNRGK